LIYQLKPTGFKVSTHVNPVVELVPHYLCSFETRGARISPTLLRRPRCCWGGYLPFLSADQLCYISWYEV